MLTIGCMVLGAGCSQSDGTPDSMPPGERRSETMGEDATAKEKAVLKGYPITVNYSQTFEDMVKAGKYDDVYLHITAKNFPVSGDGQVNTEVLLVHFGRDIESDAAIRELGQMGMVPAKIEHLLALGAKYPDVQREFPIVCLGSAWMGLSDERVVPYLGFWDHGRRLNLDYYDDEWPDICRFAALRK